MAMERRSGGQYPSITATSTRITSTAVFGKRIPPMAIRFHDVLAATGVVGTRVKLRYDFSDISHVYVFVHKHSVP